MPAWQYGPTTVKSLCMTVLTSPAASTEFATIREHRFAPHAHDMWAIGAVLRGAKDISPRRGRPAIVEAGQTYAIAPGVAHAGRGMSGQTCEYVMLYVPDAEWRMRCTMLR